MRSSRLLALAAFAAMTAMLFAQVSIAAAAWEAVPAPCHQPTPNLCASHCADNDLTLDKPRLRIPGPAVAPAPFAAAVGAPYPPVAARHVAVLPAGPPPRILFQSFLI